MCKYDDFYTARLYRELKLIKSGTLASQIIQTYDRRICQFRTDHLSRRDKAILRNKFKFCDFDMIHIVLYMYLQSISYHSSHFIMSVCL